MLQTAHALIASTRTHAGFTLTPYWNRLRVCAIPTAQPTLRLAAHNTAGVVVGYLTTRRTSLAYSASVGERATSWARHMIRLYGRTIGGPVRAQRDATAYIEVRCDDELRYSASAVLVDDNARWHVLATVDGERLKDEAIDALTRRMLSLELTDENDDAHLVWAWWRHMLAAAVLDEHAELEG